MDFPICPFCHQTIPSSELQRHANDHLDEEEFARDIELAQQIAIAPPSPHPLTDPCYITYDDKQRHQLCKGPGSLNEVDAEVLHKISSGASPESSALTSHNKPAACGEMDVDERICYLVSVQIKETFYQIEEGLVTLLRNCLELDNENSFSILSGHVDHFQSTESEDVGWGCGWRNIQMLSSHLLRQRQEAKEVLYGGAGFVPDIASLQRWLEIAWEKGFDRLGAEDFGQEIYGKRSWIGTTECAALFRSFGLRARIVDFCRKSDPSSSTHTSSHRNNRADDNTAKRKTQVHGPMDRFLSNGDCNGPQIIFSAHRKYNCSNVTLEKTKGQQVLIDWVWNYFSDDSFTKMDNQSVVLSQKAPLYFQHDGHSRTIVGIQATRKRNGVQKYNLLILDPAHRTKALQKSLKGNDGWQRLMKRGIHTLKKPEYQLCFLDPGIACGDELEELKTLHSIRLEF